MSDTRQAHRSGTHGLGMGADLWSIEGLLVQWSQMREGKGKGESLLTSPG